MLKSSHSTILILLGLLASGALLLATLLGSETFSLARLVTALQQPASLDGQLIWRLRLPRAGAGFMVGAMLAIAGCLMQVLLRNPLADPYILGVSGGAALFALVGMTLGLGASLIPPLALLGALISILLVFGLARGAGPWSGTRLLLTGVVTAAGWGALISLVLASGSDNSLRGMLFWLMGDLSYARLPGWGVAILLLVLGAALALGRSLNVLGMGESTARLLCESTQGLLWGIYFMASLLTATAVSVAGSIGFVGLIVPHLMRLLVGSDHRILLPAAALFGGTFLVLSDTLARTVVAPRQLPVGVITALLGVPLFLLLLNRARLRAGAQ